jgi:NAD-specific glutamate dehydrogenase
LGRKKRPEPDDKEQSARFIETMERMELVDNPKEAFERMVKKVVKAGRVPRTKKDSKPR